MATAGALATGAAMATGAAVNAVAGMAKNFIDKSNSIKIELINPTGTGYYVGGDTVMGKIHLICNVPFFCKGVIVQVKGEEKAKFQESEWVRENENDPNSKMVCVNKEVKDSKVFFNQKLVPYPTAGVIPAGVYEYPFQYPLPNDLPGVFKERGGDFDMGTGYKASISYKFIATVDVDFAHDLKHKVNLVVNEKYDKLVQPSFAKDSKKFLGGGKLSVNICLDKNAYFPGDRVLGKLEANSTSTKCTRAIKCKVVRTVDLRVKNKTFSHSTEVFRSEHGGFDPCFYGVKFLPFFIPMDLSPSTTGNLVKSTYNFIICCDIPGAFDLETPLNVRILAPQYLYGTVPVAPAHVPPPPDCSFRAPWQPDSSTKTCHHCNTKFTLINRRHHCRHCGNIFCKKCTTQRSTIPNLAYTEPVRVCDECYPIAKAGGNLFQKLEGF